MMDIFSNLMKQPGIHAAAVLDAGGSLMAYQGSELYDRSLLDAVCSALARALDSADLLHSDWEELQVQFGDGCLMIRNLGLLPDQSGKATLVVMADCSLNRSFATVAMRVVVQKLKRALAGGAEMSQLSHSAPVPNTVSKSSGPYGAYHAHPGMSQLPMQAAPPPYPSAPSASLPSPHVAYASTGAPSQLGSQQPEYPAHSGSLAPPLPGQRVYPPPTHEAAVPHSAPHQSEISSGLSWSGVANNRSSGMGVPVNDEAALELLTRLSQSLAPFVGPMAKVFVKEAVRQVCREVPFSRDHLGEVLRAIEAQIDDPSDCQQFRTSIRSVV